VQSDLHTLEFDRVLTLIAMEAKSAPGKEAVARRGPLRTAKECELAHARLAEMQRFYHRDGLPRLGAESLLRDDHDRPALRKVLALLRAAHRASWPSRGCVDS